MSMPKESKESKEKPKQKPEGKPAAAKVDAKHAAAPKEGKPAEKGHAKKPAGDAVAAPAPQPAAPATAAEIFAEGEKAAMPVKLKKAKGSKNVISGIAHIAASFNNTQVTITDQNGNVIGWSSSGRVGFKGSRKSTAYAAQMVAQDCARQAQAHGLKEVEIRVKGPGTGR